MLKRLGTGGPMAAYGGGKPKPKPTNQPQQQFTTLPAFMPGQRGLLADQLQNGFGGSDKGWTGLLNATYDPMRMQQPFQYGQGKTGGNQAPTYKHGTGFHVVDGRVVGSPNPGFEDEYAALVAQINRGR